MRSLVSFAHYPLSAFAPVASVPIAIGHP
jgi:hypothetical protein